VGTAPAGHAVQALVVQPVAVGIRGARRVQPARVGHLARPLRPRGDHLAQRVIGLRWTPRPMGRANDPGSSIVGQKGPQPLVTTAALGDVGLWPQGIGAMPRQGREGPSDGGPVWPAQRPDGVVPQAQEARRARRGAPATFRGPTGAWGPDVEPGQEGPAVLTDRAHHRAMTRLTATFEGPESAQGGRGGQVVGTGPAGRCQERVAGERGQRGSKETPAPALGASRARPPSEPTPSGAGGGRGPGRVGAFSVLAAGEAGQAFFF
jgi:hypothetical protein